MGFHLAERSFPFHSQSADHALDAALRHWAARTPDAPFIVEADIGTVMTYAAIASAVRRWRQALGAAPLVIALALPGGAPAAIAWLAALTGGHRLVLCSPEATADERRHLSETQRPDVVVVARRTDTFGRPDARVFTAADLATLMSPGAPEAVSAAMAATLAPRVGMARLTTSGTTGEPKGVWLTERQIAWAAEQVRRSHRLTSADRGLCVLPFFHINAPVVSLCATLLAGATVVIAPRFSVHHFWEWVAREDITWASLVPTIIAMLLSTEKPAFLPGALRFVRTASAPLPIARQLAFERQFGVAVVETYGLSEAASQVAANPVPPGRRKVGSVGRPTGVELVIAAPASEGADGMAGDAGDADDGGYAPQPLAQGVEGEICVRGPGVISGYEGDVDATSFAGGWFRTGDLGYLDADGYLFITGRLRDTINRGGEKVAPREIEEVLLAHPAIRDAAVLGAPDPLYGQRVVAFVVPADPWNARTEAALRAYCAARLSAYKTPETFYVATALPRNANGKLSRRALQGSRALEPAAGGATA